MSETHEGPVASHFPCPEGNHLDDGCVHLNHCPDLDSAHSVPVPKSDGVVRSDLDDDHCNVGGVCSDLVFPLSQHTFMTKAADFCAPQRPDCRNSATFDDLSNLTFVTYVTPLINYFIRQTSCPIKMYLTGFAKRYL